MRPVEVRDATRVDTPQGLDDVHAPGAVPDDLLERRLPVDVHRPARSREELLDLVLRVRGLGAKHLRVHAQRLQPQRLGAQHVLHMVGGNEVVDVRHGTGHLGGRLSELADCLEQGVRAPGRRRAVNVRVLGQVRDLGRSGRLVGIADPVEDLDGHAVVAVLFLQVHGDPVAEMNAPDAPARGGGGRVAPGGAGSCGGRAGGLVAAAASAAGEHGQYQRDERESAGP